MYGCVLRTVTLDYRTKEPSMGVCSKFCCHFKWHWQWIILLSNIKCKHGSVCLLAPTKSGNCVRVKVKFKTWLLDAVFCRFFKGIKWSCIRKVYFFAEPKWSSENMLSIAIIGMSCLGLRDEIISTTKNRWKFGPKSCISCVQLQYFHFRPTIICSVR